LWGSERTRFISEEKKANGCMRRAKKREPEKRLLRGKETKARLEGRGGITVKEFLPQVGFPTPGRRNGSTIRWLEAGIN